MRLHPLTCAAFNADFDGDQMAIHVPLSIDAQTEARYLMIASNNILKLSDGEPISVPYQDMLYGIYYLTVELPGEKGEGKVFADVDEAIMAYETGNCSLHSKIKVRVRKEVNGEMLSGIIDTTVGRLILNSVIPEGINIAKRETPEDMLKNEIEFAVNKKQMKKIIKSCYVNLGSTKTAIMLDKIKELGYKYSTIASLTANLFDIRVAKDREQIIKDADESATNVAKQLKRGLITKEEQSTKLLDIWSGARMKITDETMAAYEYNNPLKLMVDSGARGSKDNMCDLSGIRGLMMSTSGKVIEVPIRSSFRDGLSVIEYFIATRGGRKGMVDKALKTADAGYLTRRLVDVAQEVVIDDEDCFATLGEKVSGMDITAIYDEDSMVESISSRISGRYTVNDIINPQTGEVIVPADEMISPEQAQEIEKAGIEKVTIRTVFTCKSKYGVCAKCYGRDMSCRSRVKVGEAVGVIAAQSIGELGTQLTMNVFHGGGAVSDSDITAGLPRVEEIFEAKKPKGVAVISEITGEVTKIDPAKGQVTIVSGDKLDKNEVVYSVPDKARFKVAVGSQVKPGDRITEGAINPHDILKTRGVKETQDYMIVEVLKVYHKSGVDVNDKHLEIIIRQMLRKVRIEDSGDTSMLPGDYVEMFKFEEENERVLANGGEPATAKRVLLSITKASLATDSFLSAASFQETVKVLTDAAIKGSVDNLVGLKDNIIIGKRIPAGTGLKRYRDITPTEVVNYDDEEEKVIENIHENVGA